MTSYPFIIQLFTNILSKSAGIEGRFHLCPKYGVEINSDNFGEVLAETVIPIHGKKYPCALLMPPVSRGSEWESYRMVMFFLKQTYVTSENKVAYKNTATGTSTHTIPEDWHDMKRCAINFYLVLEQLQRARRTFNNLYRVDQEAEPIITPISLIGVDRISGVRMDFNMSLYFECVVEDYTDLGIADIVIPEGDLHPAHPM